MRRFRRTAFVAAVLLIPALSACGTTVRINGAEVDSKVPFVSVLEDAWRAGPGQDRYAQLASETGCWLLRDHDSGALEPRALCGPVRHLSDTGKLGVFDEVRYQPQLVGDHEVSVDPGSIEFGDTGVDAPAGQDLYNPERKQPTAPDQVPAPAAPKADPGLVVQGDPATIADGQTPADSLLIVPGAKITISRVGVVPTVTGAGDAPFYAPADNEEFVAATVSIEPQEYAHGSVDVKPVYSLRAEGKTTDLAPFLGAGEDDTSADQPRTATVVASVPKGKDAEIVVGVAGLDQTLSLRTGKRTSTTAAGLYRGESTFAINKQFPSQTVKNGDFSYQLGVTFTKAQVSPFDPNKGWAPDGQLWLKVGWDNLSTDGAGSILNSYDAPTFDRAKTLQLTDDTGKSIKVISGIPATDDASYSADPAVLALISDSTKKVKVTYAPQGTFAVGGLASKSTAPRDGSFAFKQPLTFDVGLG